MATLVEALLAAACVGAAAVPVNLRWTPPEVAHLFRDASPRVLVTTAEALERLGDLDDDGFVHIAGRASDLIIRGGENVYPREIEEVLHAHPDVAEAAVVGRPDPLYGEVAIAFVAPHPGHAIDEDTLRAWCAARLADYERPVRVTVLPRLPKGPTGKILKAPLRTRSDP